MHSQTSNTIAENLEKDFISHFDIQLEIHKVEVLTVSLFRFNRHPYHIMFKKKITFIFVLIN